MEEWSKGAKQVSSTLMMPEVNKLSAQLSQLSGKIGISSDTATKAAVSQARFTSPLYKLEIDGAAKHAEYLTRVQVEAVAGKAKQCPSFRYPLVNLVSIFAHLMHEYAKH